jgi:hypothetical protein
MGEAGKTATRVYTMVRLHKQKTPWNAAKSRESAVEALMVLISSARNRAFYGWARADLNHRIPGFPDAE